MNIKTYNDDKDGKYASVISFDDSIIDVIIPESISFENQIIPVKKIDKDAFKNNSKIRSITIPNSVTTIGSSAFNGCSSLTSIYIPDSVTTIGSFAFIGCSNLTIYCEAPSKPSGWSSLSWNYSNRPVVWSSYLGMHGYFNDFEYGVCIGEDGNKYITITGYNASNTDVVIPESINVNGENIIVKAIADNAFYNNDAITSVTISDSVTTIGSSAFKGCSNLTTVTIGENSQLTTIGSSAFNGCSSLTSIYIPISVTSIGSSAFEGCSSLTSIYIPDSVTTIGSFAFIGCSNLTIYCEAPSKPSGWNSLWNDAKRPVMWNSYLGVHGYFNDFEYGVCIDDDGNEYITILGYNGSNTNVVIPEYIKVKGKDIVVKAIADNTFYDNDKIASVTIPSSVTTIGSGAFFNCSSLTSIYIPDSVTTIGGDAFYNCRNLTTVTFGDNSRLTTIGSEAFYDCSSLTSIYIPDSVTTIGSEAFYNCSSLTTSSIYIPDSVTTIGSEAFCNCSSLTSSIYIPDSVTTIGSGAFYNCSNLTIYCAASFRPSGWDSSWDYPCSVVWNCISSFEISDEGLHFVVVLGKNGDKYITIAGYTGSSTNVVIPSSINVNEEDIPVKAIASNAFYNNDTIRSITIPDSVTTIGYSAFCNCSSLTSIYIHDSVTTIESYAFDGCTNLTIYCQARSKPSGWANRWWNPSSRPVVWSSYLGMHGYFNDFGYGVCIDDDGNKCITILGYNGSNTNVVIAEYIKVNGKDIVVKAIADNTFYDNDKIASVTIPSSVTTIGSYAFEGCSSLTSIYIPDSVTTIGSDAFSHCSNLATVTFGENSQLTSIGYGAFSDCSSLTSIYIPNSVTKIEDHGFCDCSNLTTVTFSEGSQLTSIGYSAFCNCSSLTSIYIPDGVTSIDDNAFYGCSNLTTVTISENSQLTSIGSSAFSGCSSLTSIYIPDSVATIGSYAFVCCTNLTIYCEASSQPSSWDSNWNPSNRPVAWETTYKEYLAEIA